MIRKRPSFWWLLLVLPFFLLGALDPVIVGSYLDFASHNPHKVASGDYDVTRVSKFGEAPDIDTDEDAAGYDIWDCGDIPTDGAGPSVYPYNSAADSLWISSDSAADTEVINVQGLDANWDPASVNVTLSGITLVKVGATDDWIRVFRAKSVDGSAALVGNIYLSDDDTDAAVADGIPDNWATSAQACVLPGNEQTLMAIYTIPNGFTGYVDYLDIAVNPATGATTEVAKVGLYARDNGGQFRIQYKTSLVSGGANHVFRPYRIPLKYAEKTDLKLHTTIVASSNTHITGSFDLVLIPTE